MTQIFTAKTVEEAMELAARTFGAAKEDINFEILEEPKKGLFGFKKGEARIRATYMSVKIDEEPEAPVQEVIETEAVAESPAPAEEISFEEESVSEDVTVTDFTEDAPAAEEAPAEETLTTEALMEETFGKELAEQLLEAAAPAEEEKKPEPIPDDADLISGEPTEAGLAKIEKAKAYLTGILEKLGVEAELKVTAGAESAMIDIETPNSGAVIGKRGETLDALQYLVFMIANRGDKEYYRIILNSANYRERRRKTLEELAAKIARNVLRSGRQTTLEPMNPYERRIIHSAISEIEGVASRSVGEEPYRKVVISSLSRPNRRRRSNDNRGEKGERNHRGRRNDNRQRRNPDAPPTRISMDSMKTSFEKDYKRPRPEDDLNAGLYGKIEF